MFAMAMSMMAAYKGGKETKLDSPFGCNGSHCRLCQSNRSITRSLDLRSQASATPL